MRPRSAAFTLIELLVVIAVVAILAGVLFPAIGAVQTAGRKVQSLANMKQLGTALVLYTGQNNGQLPLEGEQSPSWDTAAVNTDTNNAAWYNALPRLCSLPGVGDFKDRRPDFYTKANLLYVPSALYPSTKGTAPLFAVSFCSKLFTSGIDLSAVRLQNVVQPSKTVVFQESGLPGEKKIYSTQSSYNGQSKSFASRSITRYGGKTVIVFADGHAETLSGVDIVDQNLGKAYSPQTKGRVFWTMDPTVDANL